MIYKADSRGQMDLKKIAGDVAEAFKKGDMNMTVLVDMTDYIHALIQKSLREKEEMVGK